MSDDKNNRGQPDRSRISLEQEHELRYWTQALGVSQEELSDAIAAVGPNADAVRQYFSDRRGANA